ncbi:hypothetical protein EB72_24740 [Mycobacterium sp. SWH-M1]|nr:hypothetical protein EB72_24740 [Mycobacterium sp. SWH-M1]
MDLNPALVAVIDQYEAKAREVLDSMIGAYRDIANRDGETAALGGLFSTVNMPEPWPYATVHAALAVAVSRLAAKEDDGA